MDQRSASTNSPKCQTRDIIKSHPNDEPTQIDKIAQTRRWFRPNDDSAGHDAIKEYLNGAISVSEAAERIATPIDKLYSTADGWKLLHAAEKDAVDQRQYWTPEEAKERWGEPLNESDIPPLENENEKWTTEGYLWDLWYGVLHEAKKISWKDTGKQEKLLDLVRALKTRPDPPQPKIMTKALRNNWIWGNDHLWSVLLMLGPSGREAWNDLPRDSPTLPEIHAWTNVNAFVAKLSQSDIYDFWLYAIWALRPALEEEYSKTDVVEKDGDESEEGGEPEPTDVDILIPAAAVWILVLGKDLYNKERDWTPARKCEGDPAGPGSLYKGKSTMDKGRWAFWKARFAELHGSSDLKMSKETRLIIEEALRKMNEVESGS